MGYFEVFWHSDIKQFVDCETSDSLRKRYKSHNDIVNRLFDRLEELKELKEGVMV